MSFVSSSELRKVFRISTSRLQYEWLPAGLPCLKLGKGRRRRLFDLETVREWVIRTFGEGNWSPNDHTPPQPPTRKATRRGRPRKAVASIKAEVAHG